MNVTRGQRQEEILTKCSRLASNTDLIQIIDVLTLRVTIVLIFSTWYWIIDPPGIIDEESVNESYDLLFPQRS